MEFLQYFLKSTKVNIQNCVEVSTQTRYGNKSKQKQVREKKTIIQAVPAPPKNGMIVVSKVSSFTYLLRFIYLHTKKYTVLNMYNIDFPIFFLYMAMV